jgi:hypothetical protein
MTDPGALQASALSLVMWLWVTGRPQEAMAVHERAVSAATAAGAHDLVLRLELHWIMIAQPSPIEALRRIEPYTTRVDPDSLAGRLVDASVAWYGSMTGRPASEALERGRRAFADGRVVTDLQDDWLILGGCVFGLMGTDELELCERIIEQC